MTSGAEKATKRAGRGIGLALAAVLLLTAFRFSLPQEAYAYSAVLYTYTVKVESGYLALRNGQSYDKKNEIGELYTGETVVACPTASEKNGYWYVYSPKLRKLGYVNASYLTYKGVYVDGDILYAKVKTGYLALRKAKKYEQSNEIGKLYTGDPVILLDDTDASYWTVYAPTISKAGFVNKDYLVGYSSSASYAEPSVPAVIDSTSYAEWYWPSSSSDYLNFHMEVTNVSRTKTVVAFDTIFYAEDVYGDKIYGDRTVYRLTTEKTILPGETVYSDYAALPNRNRIRRVYAAVTKAKLSDGTVCEYSSIPISAYGHWDVK
ncbi:MAG: hypothetical protein Q4D81_05860 [Eubacteriales bacterium]|nr:hypothetical protein [Eubacteriales bacterium]